MKKSLTLYHGSKDIIEKPEFGAGKPYNDYGLGFYCTESLELAKEWACQEKRDGYANCYIMNMADMRILNLSDDFHILNWLAILLENRTFIENGDLAVQGKMYILNEFLPDYKQYDIIIGYRADDSYFQFARDFVQGTISLKTLGKAMQLGKLGEQVVLKSRKAFEEIVFQKAEKAEHREYYGKRLKRDKSARELYSKERAAKPSFDKEEIYMVDILREEMKDDDKRLRRSLFE